MFGCRKEQVWPELDQLLRDEDDTSGASTPYTAAVPEYRVVLLDPVGAPRLDKNLSLANGHAVHDIHHPCRFKENYCHFLESFVPDYLQCTSRLTPSNGSEDLMWLCAGSCILQPLIALAFTWNSISLALGSREFHIFIFYQSWKSINI